MQMQFFCKWLDEVTSHRVIDCKILCNRDCGVESTATAGRRATAV
jgi:hypothetical protein